jgi:hypothetical protein
MVTSLLLKIFLIVEGAPLVHLARSSREMSPNKL